jgi:hypothetical protein
MDIVKDFLEKDGNSLANTLANSFGLDSSGLSKIFADLLPELNTGIQSKLASGPAGFTSLIKGIDMDVLGRAFAGASTINDSESKSLGTSLLNNIFDGENGHEDLLNKLTASSGIASETLAEILPQLTSSFMSYFSKAGGTSASQIPSSFSVGGALSDSLGKMLDEDGDGEIADDLVDAAKKLFQ